MYVLRELEGAAPSSGCKRYIIVSQPSQHDYSSNSKLVICEVKDGSASGSQKFLKSSPGIAGFPDRDRTVMLCLYLMQRHFSPSLTLRVDPFAGHMMCLRTCKCLGGRVGHLTARTGKSGADEMRCRT
ncbi:hypothetical protein DPX16_16085 [Anabarilius grahami]|uniref:Uncharacterized protein n=1 Tax=Anabarilius grahami TaxID=495550 RepID=A0A3N0YND2_ANAGA|nr:hypothetical protein DPX16_16085 [Anabarilius grahami]